MVSMKPRVCELCNGEASVYCISDSAFLCWDCDTTVHGANFLVARHGRQILCGRCKQLDSACFSGVRSSAVGSFLCRSCASDASQVSDCESDSDSSSSTCISCSRSSGTDTVSRSSKFSATRQRRNSSVAAFSALDRGRATAYVDAKGERLLEHWCRRLGLRSSRLFRSVALRALEACLRTFKILPFRVCLAASLWFAADVCHARRDSMLQLRRLEEYSGVPAKLILLAESKLRRLPRVKTLKRQTQEEEGWAEC
ncbi:B-box zinc finger protein 32-like [Aristolochia californica]|uniref:B-box zinc finger protein 32-like n=1 Tax=Aristolochia californica TaxID=171875 RepID=UPI0035E11D31